MGIFGGEGIRSLGSLDVEAAAIVSEIGLKLLGN